MRLPPSGTRQSSRWHGRWDLGPAECCRAGKPRGLDRKSDDKLSTDQSFSVLLPAARCSRGRLGWALAERGCRAGAGSRVETRAHAGVRRVGGDGTKRETGSRNVGGQKYQPTSRSQKGRSTNGHGQPMAMGNRMEWAMANLTGRRARERSRASIPRQGTDGGQCINITACTKGRYLRGCRKKVACPVAGGCLGRREGTYACADIGLAVSGIDRAHGA